MANTTFNTRIKLKYDTLANWTTNKAKILLQGEVGLCYVPAVTNGTTTTAPTVLFKVGDGKTTWEKLPWGSGLAADVYDWAKAATKPSYDYSEITNAPTMTVDTNTTYKLVQDTTDSHKFTLQSQEKGASTWTIVSTIVIPDNDHNDNQTIKVGSTAFGVNDVVLFEGDGVTITPDTKNKKITFKVEQATNAATADKATEADHASKADNADKATEASKVTNSFSFKKTPAKKYDGSSKLTYLANDINETLTLKVGSNNKTYDGSTATTFEITAADLGLNSAMHFLGISTTEVTDHGAQEPTIGGSAVTPAEGDVVLYNHEEFVWAKVGASGALAWERLGRDSSFALAEHTHEISATAKDDDVVVLTGTAGNLGVTYEASHAKKGPSTTTSTVKGATADVSVSGYGDSKTIKVPKVTVDQYGHTTGLTEQTLTITMPSAQTLPAAATVAPKNLGTAAIGTSTKYAREDHVHKMPTLNEIGVNITANYVIFDCGSSTVNI